MSLADFFHEAATGPKRRRVLLTPVGFLAFGATLVIVVAGGLLTDRALGLPHYATPGAAGADLRANFPDRGTVTLEPGDSVFFDCSMGHAYLREGDQEVVILFVNSNAGLTG